MRTRMITRTIKVTDALVMVTDINEVDNPTICYRSVRLTGDVSENEVTKVCKKRVEEEKGIIFACVVNVLTTETLYGMSEEEFLMWAEPIER